MRKLLGGEQMLNADQKNNDLVKKSISEFVREILCDKSKKGNIAILVSVFSKFEGAGKAAEQHAKELSKEGYSISVLTFVSDIIPSENFKISIIKPMIPLNNPFLNKIYRGLFLFNAIKVMMLTRKLKEFDLIILHHGTLANLSYVVKKFYGTKVIFCNHHVIDPGFSPILINLVMRTYQKLISRIHWKLIKKFDHVVSVSEFSRGELKKRVGLDSIVIHNTIDNKRFKETLDGKIVRDKYHIEKEPLILFVGRIIPYKGIHLLIDAFKMVTKKIPNAKLIIVGKHCDKIYSKKLMKMNDEQMIFFAENVSDEELPFYYAASDVYATCSLFEGFNLPLIEAQACGKPVVAFDIGPHKEIVKRGFLVKEGDTKEFSDKLVEILMRKVKT